MKRILLAEDESTLRAGIAEALREKGHEVIEAPDGSSALRKIDEEGIFDLIITDMKMPGADGIEVVRRAKMVNEGAMALVMTAHGTVEGAVEAMQAGAFDYVQKPFSLDGLELKVRRAIEHGKLLQQLQSYRFTPTNGHFANMIGESPLMKEIFRTITKVAPSAATLLILGETGTGKELIAEAIHRNSERKDGPFVKMNCAALHENLLESELFGHERGAFTGAERQRAGRFELADEGTLFLDEIGNMSLATQAKVLRVLQERQFERLGGTKTLKVDVRLIAATNRNLEDAIKTGEFREDLFYRLNVVTIQGPPLRVRWVDIVPLSRHFRKRFCADLKKPLTGFTKAAVRALSRHNWPGNIRELENAIERAVLMCEGSEVDVRDLNLPGYDVAGVQTAPGTLKLPPEGLALDELERQAILEALRVNAWVQKDAAKFLGISSRVMNYKIQKYEITNPRWIKNKADE
jgi:DNA-binding NtrC family response regulator